MSPVSSLLLFFFLINAILGFGYLMNTLHLFEWLKALVFIDMILFPLLVFLFSFHSWYYQIKKANPGWLLKGLAIGILGLLYYMNQVEPYRLQVRRIQIKSEKIDRPIRLLHISDIQAVRITSYEERVFREIQSLNPDVIIHSGDLIQNIDYEEYKREIKALAALFQRLKVPYGIYNVIGDTDDFLEVASFDKASGVKTLRDEGFQIPELQLNILGLKLASSRYGKSDLILEWQRERNENDFSILLGHAPDYILDGPSQQADLYLAGHTHGGQIRLPFWGALINHSRVPLAWSSGFFSSEGKTIHISAGIGAEHAYGLPSLRFNCPPEITLIELN